MRDHEAGDDAPSLEKSDPRPSRRGDGEEFSVLVRMLGVLGFAVAGGVTGFFFSA